MAIACIECGQLPKLVSGKKIYPHRPDLYVKHYWLCECGAYVGCHPGGTVPLGSPAGSHTRTARAEAHAAFDVLWTSGGMTRSAAYRWLASLLNIPVKQCHIGTLTKDECYKVTKASTLRFASLGVS